MTDEVLDNPQGGPSQEQNQPPANPAAPANPANPAAPANIINTPDDKVPAVPQTWPDNWREIMANGDDKELARLQRLKAPNDVYKSYRELEKIKSSFVPAPKKPGEGATPEEVKAYRDHLGIPENPKDYDLNFGDGTVVGEEVMPHLEGFLKHAHDNNMPPDQVKSAVKFYLDDIERVQQQIAHTNDEARVNGLAELKSEWGGEFKGNLNSIQSLFTEAPEGTMEALMGAAGPDGLKFANNPDNIRWLVGLAKAINPTASLLPSGVTDSTSIDTELDKLKGMMNSKDPVERDRYWKDPKAQERFLALTQAKTKAR